MIKILNDLDSTDVKNYWKVTGTNDETFPYLLIDKWYNPEELDGIWKELDFYQSCPDHHQVRTEDKETPVSREPGGLSRAVHLDFIFGMYTLKIVKGITTHIF